MPWKVIYFTKVSKFLDKVNEKDQAKIKLAVQFLRDYGPFLKEPFSKKISNNLTVLDRVKLII